MIISRTILPRAWLSTVVTSGSSRVMLSTNRGYSRLLKLTFPTRAFSVSCNYPVNRTDRFTILSSHKFPSFSTTKTTRQDTYVKPGTEFTYHKINRYLTPRGWSNDPHDLEGCLGLKIHDEHTTFPRRISPVLAYTGEDAGSDWCGHLLCEGSDVFDPVFYMVLSDRRVFRLETEIELMPLLVCMKEHADVVAAEEGGTTFGLKELLEHPGLDWYEFRQDELTDICAQATS